ncbi:hypothetical protein C8R43DRAFT_1116191 [Mycena crocata]|nr:hypothetical protein C8R43DRAFT_1116191 [Mycena crocata]
MSDENSEEPLLNFITEKDRSRWKRQDRQARYEKRQDQGMYTIKSPALVALGKYEPYRGLERFATEMQALRDWAVHCYHHHTRCRRHSNAYRYNPCPQHNDLSEQLAQESYDAATGSSYCTSTGNLPPASPPTPTPTAVPIRPPPSLVTPLNPAVHGADAYRRSLGMFHTSNWPSHANARAAREQAARKRAAQTPSNTADRAPVNKHVKHGPNIKLEPDASVKIEGDAKLEVKHEPELEVKHEPKLEASTQSRRAVTMSGRSTPEERMHALFDSDTEMEDAPPVYKATPLRSPSSRSGSSPPPTDLSSTDTDTSLPITHPRIDLRGVPGSSLHNPSSTILHLPSDGLQTLLIFDTMAAAEQDTGVWGIRVFHGANAAAKFAEICDETFSIMQARAARRFVSHRTGIIFNTLESALEEADGCGVHVLSLGPEEMATHIQHLTLEP